MSTYPSALTATPNPLPQPRQTPSPVMCCSGTPVIEYEGIFVKREDLCALPPGPPFSKFRGVIAHVAQRMETTIGVLDTAHSKAGWAVAAACRELGKRCINYYPRYKAEPEGIVRPAQQRAKDLGAELVELTAGRSAILYHRAKKLLAGTGEWTYLMPNALKLYESVEETALEAQRTEILGQCSDVVISISSGTIAAGVLRGMARKHWYPRVHIHLGYDRSLKAVLDYLKLLAPDFPVDHLNIINEGYAYSDAVSGPCLFPCNEYYDLKAWKWIKMNDWLGHDVVFWNIGA